MSMFKRNYRKVTSAFSKKETEPIARRKETEPVVREKEPKKTYTMVPLFSLKSIISIAIGVIIGAGLGLGYWIISPSLNSPDQPATETEPGGLTGVFGMPHEGPYESTINIQVVSTGSSYLDLKALQRVGEYYAAKANSLPVLKFLSQELTEQAPQFAHTTEELEQMIEIKYDWSSEIPAMELKVTGNSNQEASFLAGFAPESFKNYLVEEAKEAQQQEYQNTLNEIETIKATILEEEKELSALAPQWTATDISNDPNYIALNAKIEALELELENQAYELSLLIASGGDDEVSNIAELEYQKTLQEARSVSTALYQAEQKLQTLQMERFSSVNGNSPDYTILNAKVRALELEIDRLMTGDDQTTGLADMIARGVTTGTTYKETVEKVETASAALSEARRELAILESQSIINNSAEDLEYQLAQDEVNALNMELSVLQDRLTALSREIIVKENQPDTQEAFERTSAALAEARKELTLLASQPGNEHLSKDLEYRVLQQKIDTLNSELATLTEKLSSLLGDNIDTEEITGFLVVGRPSIPLPVIQERIRGRNALMMGGIIGLCGAWVALNFRWITKGMPSSNAPKHREEEEEEA